MLTAATLLSLMTLPGDDFARERMDYWHQCRGPLATGWAPRGDPPAQWSESKNIKWKVEVPGSGSSTPIVWGNRIFVLTAVKTDRKSAAPAPVAPPPSGPEIPNLTTPVPDTLYRFEVLCLDRDTGNVLWRRVAREEVPRQGHHPSHGYASGSPVTDGKFLYVTFGSRGFYCYDLDGSLKWEADLGDMTTKMGFGEGASPALHGGSLVVPWDHEGGSFIACLDAATGKERWRTARDERTTCATPLVVERDGAAQVVTNGTNRTRSYDLSTGRLLWECGGQTANPIPSPVEHEGTVLCMSGFRGNAVFAIPLNATGDLTNGDKVAWKRTDAAPYVASPLLHDGLLYFTKERQGILSCADVKTGTLHYGEQRLPGIGTLYASITGAAGKIYIAGREGVTLVLKHGPSCEILAENRLDEGMNASPVIVGKQLFLRGHKHLYCVAAP
jgi:outer membrane protein assembly factor BamB